MKKITFFIISLFATAFSAQTTKAITENGKEVVLFENGTWRFVDESDAKALETISTNPSVFNKSKDANFPLRSSKINVVVHYNTKLWSMHKRNIPNMEYYFYNDEIYASLTTERTEIHSLKTVKEVLVTNIQQSADYFRLKESEYRTVNGKKMLYMRYIANIKGIDFEYAGYYFINNEGLAMLVAYTIQKEFDKKFPAIETFLNGLAEVNPNDKTPVVTETVEVYSSPPPPMKMK